MHILQERVLAASVSPASIPNRKDQCTGRQPPRPAGQPRQRVGTATAATASDGGTLGGCEEQRLASFESVTADANGHCAAREVQAHAFIAKPQTQLLMDPLGHLGPGVHGAPFPTTPLGAHGGWVVAAAVLLAARMGRLTAQEARMDVFKLQFERERSRALGRELLAERDRWRATEAQRTAAKDSRRVEEAAAKAREEVRRQHETQQRYQEVAATEAERMRQEHETQRKKYETWQAKLDAEIAVRAEQERVIIEQQRAAAKAAEEQRRREEEEQQRRIEEEQRQQKKREQQVREVAIWRKIEERRHLEKEKKRFAMRLEGTVAAERPPKGTVLPGPLQKKASVRLTASCATLLGGPAAPLPSDFASLAEAEEGLPAVVGGACRQAADGYSSAMRLKSMSGESMLQWIDDTELQHFACTAAVRATVAGVAAGEARLAAFQQDGSGASQPAPFQSRTELGVLPTDHPQRTEALLRRVIIGIEGGDIVGAATLLDDIVLAEVELFCTDLPACPRLSEAATALMGTALLLSHLISRALAERPFASSDAPSWFEDTTRLACGKLQAAAAGAAKDTLQLPAVITAAVLGRSNPVAEELVRLAEANQSAETKQMQQERERLLAAELAGKLVEEEWPDAAQTKAARLAERQAKTPVPEHCWALRNVASQLSTGSRGERTRARQLLEQAVLLKQQIAGAPDHPGVLPELLPLVDLLAADPEWQQDAAGAARLAMRCLTSVAAAYRQRGDATSASILLEAALRKFEGLVEVRAAMVEASMLATDAALNSLTLEQHSAVASAQPKGETCVARVVAALTDELGAYQQGGPVTKVQRWDAEGSELIGPLH